MCRPTQHFSLGPIAVTSLELVTVKVAAVQTLSHAGLIDQQRPALEKLKILIARALPNVLRSVLRGEKPLSNWLLRRSLVEAQGQEWDRE